MSSNQQLCVLLIPSVSNPEFQMLADALTQSGCEVYTDINEFWKPSRHYNVLHTQLPEFLEGFSSKQSTSKQYASEIRISKQLNVFRDSGTKIIWTAFNLKGHEQKHIGKKNCIYSAIVKLCHGIIIIAPIGKNELISSYPLAKQKPIITIPHGNYIGVYPDTISRSEARKVLKIKEEEIVLLYFGLQRKYKDIYLVFKAFKDSYKENNNIRLLLVGQPFTYRRKLFFIYITLFYRNITVIPTYIPDNKIQLYFKAADIAVFAFKKMFTSGSIILAESFGLPIIAPNIGCFPDQVPKSVGFLYKHGDKAHLSKTIMKAINSDLKRKGRRAREFQCIKDWKSIGIKTKAFYVSILSNDSSKK
jgi:glycosyltransferase involved in cell wall biosynthesis